MTAVVSGRTARLPLRDTAAWGGLLLALLCWIVLVTFSGPGPRDFRPSPAPEMDDGKLRVVIDAGHGGHDGGAVAHGFREKDLCLDLALRLRRELEKAGRMVVLTRSDDTYVSLRDRIGLANQFRRSFFVSLHFNHGAATGAKGIETYYSDPKSPAAMAGLAARLGLEGAGEDLLDGRGQGFARAIQEALLSATGALDRGVKNQPGFAVTRHVVTPAVLVECAFLSNPEEAELLRGSAYRDRLAEGLAAGIATYLRESGGDPYFGVRKRDPEGPDAGRGG